MFDSRRTHSTQKMKNHFAFNDHRDIRIECFTNLDTNLYNQNLIQLRTGKFKISRNDTQLGKRYFINDYRESDIEPNAVMVCAESMIKLIDEHDVLPIYSRDDINIYNIGTYNHPQIKKRLIISSTTIYEEKVKT